MSGYRLLDLLCACICRCRCSAETEELYGDERRRRIERYRRANAMGAHDPVPRGVSIVNARETPLAAALTYMVTGDVLLFASKDAAMRRRVIGCRRSLTANCIRATTGSPFTHVGMVVRCVPGAWMAPEERVAPLNEGAREQLYLWHAPSTSVADIPDQITGAVKAGPQLTPLEQAMRAYARGAQDVYVRAVHCDGVTLLNERPNSALMSPRDGGSESDRFMAFMRDAARKAYKSDAGQLLRAVYDVGPLGANEADYREYFCSELVAHTLMKLGVWHDYDELRDAAAQCADNAGDMQPLIARAALTPPNEYVPGDFTQSSGTRLPWKSGYSLNPKKLLVS